MLSIGANLSLLNQTATFLYLFDRTQQFHIENKRKVNIEKGFAAFGRHLSLPMMLNKP